MADVNGIGASESGSLIKSFFKTEPSESDRDKERDRNEEDSRVETLSEGAGGPENNAGVRATERTDAQQGNNTQQNSASTGQTDAGERAGRTDTVTLSEDAETALREAPQTATPDSRETATIRDSAESDDSAPTENTTTANDSGEATSSTSANTATDRGDETTTVRETASNESQAAASEPTAANDQGPTAVEAAQAGGTERPESTNQTTRNENSTSQLNGNEQDQSEQTRTLGQVVDVFA